MKSANHFSCNGCKCILSLVYVAKLSRSWLIPTSTPIYFLNVLWIVFENDGYEYGYFVLIFKNTYSLLKFLYDFWIMVEKSLKFSFIVLGISVGKFVERLYVKRSFLDEFLKSSNYNLTPRLFMIIKFPFSLGYFVENFRVL